MSKLRREKQHTLLDITNKKKTLEETTRTLKNNAAAIQRNIDSVQKVENRLKLDRDEILNVIDQRVQEIREELNRYVEVVHEELQNKYVKNMKNLQENESMLHLNLTVCKQDIVKCEDALQEFDSRCGIGLMVNKAKVLDMIIESVDKTKFVSIPIEAYRMALDEIPDNCHIKRNIETMVGNVVSKQYSIGEVQNPVSLVRYFPTSQSEVNTVALNLVNGKDNVWMCSGVSNELVNYNETGARLKIIATDFKINDIAVSAGSRIYATSPDSTILRCLKITRNGGYVQLFALYDKLFLHAVTMCRNNETLAVCGTDTPNYTSLQPNEVVVIEYTYDGEELKRFAISNYSGKVYRLAQSMNNNYILTFPKEGKLVSVDSFNGEIKASFDKNDFRMCLSSKVIEHSSIEFWPSGVCCDTKGHIFVTEYLKKLLLMFDMDCNMLRFIGENHAGPNAICFHTDASTLWMGDKGNLKVWMVQE